MTNNTEDILVKVHPYDLMFYGGSSFIQLQEDQWLSQELELHRIRLEMRCCLLHIC